MSFQIFVMIWLAHFNTVFLLPVWLKYLCCVRARDVVMVPKIIDEKLIRRMSECRVRFGHFFRSFLSPTIYKSVSTKIILMSGSVLRASIYLHNWSTEAVHMPWIILWLHWYVRCIVSGDRPHHSQRLFVVCTSCFMIVMVNKVLLINLWWSLPCVR